MEDVPATSECPGCLGAARLLWRLPAQSRDDDELIRLWGQSNHSAALYRCDRCHLIHRSPLPASQQLAQFYDADHVGKWCYAESENAAWAIARRSLEEHARGRYGYRVLDFGAGEGGFLTSLPAAWSKFACESSEGRRRKLEDAGLAVFASIETPELRQSRFDAICLFDVFEHLLNPTQLLTTLGRMLRPGGIILLSTADGSSLPFRWLKADHWYFRTPLHLVLANEAYFSWFASTTQIELQRIVRCGHRSFSPSSWMDDVVSVMHWVAKREGGAGRLLQRLIQALPRYRSLKHRRLSPHSPRLQDHMVVRLGNRLIESASCDR